MRIPAAILPLVLMVSCQTITEPDILAESDPDPEPRSMSVVGYHAWWSGDAWRTYDYSALDELYFFSLEIGHDGRVSEAHGWPEAWQDLIGQARATGTEIVPSVTILDSETYRTVLSDSAATAALIEELVTLASASSADGVHLDFEMFDPVSPEVRQALTHVVAETRARLDQLRPDARVTMYMLAEDHADVMDEVALAGHLDQLIVQAYDMHWQTGNVAGPIAPIEGWGGRNWRGILNRYVAMGIPTSKMLFTVPYFGYEWPTTDYLPGATTTGEATVLAYGSEATGIPSARERADQYGKLRDETSGSPYYAYQDSLGWRQGWFEDGESIAEKYLFALGEGLGGVAIFPLAYGDRELMVTLSAARSQSLVGVAP